MTMIKLVDRLSASEQFRRNRYTSSSGSGAVKEVLEGFHPLERDRGGRFAFQHTRGDLAGGQPAVVKIAGHCHKRAILYLGRGKRHQWQASALGRLRDAGKA